MNYKIMPNRVTPRSISLARLWGLASVALLCGAAAAALPPEVLDPEVTIEEFSNRTEEAYWVNQRRAAIKVTPKYGGAPYYLVDPNADGAYEMRRGGPDIDHKPSMWKVLEW